MPIYRSGEGETSNFGWADLPADSTWDVAKANASEALRGGILESLNRMQEDARAQSGEEAYWVGPGGIVQHRNKREVPMLDVETAKAKIKESGTGLTPPDQPISAEYLDLKLERKRAQNAYELQASRAPDGVASGTVQFLGSIAGSLADPANLAMSMLPVVGEAKVAAMLEKAAGPVGRFGVRAGVGAVEGTVGMALAEPITAMDRLRNDQEYTAGTAIQDILMGGAMGAVARPAFHAFGRLFGDERLKYKSELDNPDTAISRMDKADPAINEAAMKAILEADSRGARVDIDSIIDLDPRTRPTLPGETPRVSKAEMDKLTQTKADAETSLKNFDDTAASAFTKRDFMEQARQEMPNAPAREVAKRAEAMAAKAASDSRAPLVVAVDKAQAAIEASMPKSLTRLSKYELDQMAARGETPPVQDAAAPTVKSINGNSVVDGNIGAVKQSIAESRLPEADRFADPKAAAEAQKAVPLAERIGELPDAEAEAALAHQQLKDILDAERPPAKEGEAQGKEKPHPELEALAKIDSETSVYLKAMKVAATCGIR
jgi:hypothetical protein